jgi:hypothetical protein
MVIVRERVVDVLMGTLKNPEDVDGVGSGFSRT